MAAHWRYIRNIGMVWLSLVGLMLLVLALVWPSRTEHIFLPRSAAASLGLFLILLNQDLREGLNTGFRIFMKATAEIAEEIRRIIDGDDGDGPRTT